MQLPRGRFHRLIKSTTPRALLEEMGSAQFTGICTIVLGSETAALVLNEGLVVLAGYGSVKGQHALDAMLEGEGIEVAAELNLLTPEQVKLALEFNRPFAIAIPDAGRTRGTSSGKAAPGGAKPSAVPKRTGPAPSAKHRPETPAEEHRIPMPGVKPVREKAGAPESEREDLDALIQNMEEMNVDQLVSNFRVSCKSMLKKINLDHLIQDKDT